MSRLRHAVADPMAPSVIALAAIGVAGVIAIVLGWRSAAATLNVAFQMPGLVSGGLGGLALVLVASSLISVQADRRWRAEERAETDALLDDLAELVEVALRARSSR
ncbi:MAG: hypothetical protein ACYDAD_12695 [Acidimicrobiales bacterium]